MWRMASATPSQPRLLAIIELQNAIAAAAMNADDVMHIVVDRACGLVPVAGAVIALVDGEELVYRAVAGAVAEPTGHRVPRTAGLAGRCIVDRRALVADDVPGERAPGTGPSPVACVPLLYGEIAVGVLAVVADRPIARGDGDRDDDGGDVLDTLRLLAQIVAIALHRAYTYPRPRYDSLQDALTGLGNRRAFDERLDAELSRYRRFGHSFSLALIQLEGLEAAIDRLGQPAGDDMLRRTAAILKSHTRMIDGSFRIRADELAIVMPGTSLGGAQIVADRCRAHALDARVPDAGVRLLLGVASAAMTDDSAAQVVARAAAALANDKASGSRS